MGSFEGVCFTSCNNTYLDRASVLARSFKRHHPNWKFVVLLSDEFLEREAFLEMHPYIDEIFEIRNLTDVFSASWAFMHDPEELCTAVKPFYSRWLLNSGVERVIFLDPDTVVLRPLFEVTDKLEKDAFLLTPHIWAPSKNKKHIDLHEISCLAHGVFNLGFFAHSNGEGAREVVDYWCDRLRDYCYRDHGSGIFTDQKWANFFPIFFECVEVLKDRTLNVSSWNLVNLELRGSIPLLYNGAEQIGFVHFSGLNNDVFVWAASEVGQATNTVVSIFEWYKDAVIRSRISSPHPHAKKYNFYSDGKFVRKSHRVHYRSNPDLWPLYPDPYENGSNDSYFAREVEAKENELLQMHENPKFILRRF